ncbi:MAG: hypothetical protein Q7N87_01690 [Candidatus Uhrbacteria bacterium]|nr:hypothetical protein [Candidatus Uhrbacteria bacterium]MDP3794207.1 hypothetical protein [Candidatus Uhrbacteria bacterium]
MSGKSGRDGGAVLLEGQHSNMLNPWGQPVIGWIPTAQGVGGLHNSRGGYAMLRVVVQKRLEDVLCPIYDQPVLIENPGAVVIAQLEDRVGFVQNFRMVGERILPNAGADYVRNLEESGLWSELIKSLGRWCWECPRGLVPPDALDGSGELLEAFVLRTAKLEALEEAGFKLQDAHIVGRVNANSTFFPHAQYVVHARIVSRGSATPESLEMIGTSKLFSMKELRTLNERGEFDDGLTLAALALCGLTL